MLTITPAAAAAIDAYADASPELPDGGCARIARRVGENGQPALTIGLAEAPGPGDAIIAGTSVIPLFVEPTTAEMLGDKVLDTRREGDAVAFVLADGDAVV
ncbi:MAG TPA: hypothetical protein VHX88_10830 [Solirubrobacteraceae bacterium]|jgi:hypothetical protein|nr:hypothetical protein [Solirubrobacteraceae bacterium]